MKDKCISCYVDLKKILVCILCCTTIQLADKYIKLQFPFSFSVIIKPIYDTPLQNVPAAGLVLTSSKRQYNYLQFNFYLHSYQIFSITKAKLSYIEFTAQRLSYQFIFTSPDFIEVQENTLLVFALPKNGIIFIMPLYVILHSFTEFILKSLFKTTCFCSFHYPK